MTTVLGKPLQTLDEPMDLFYTCNTRIYTGSDDRLWATRPMRVTLDVSPHEDNITVSKSVARWLLFQRDLPDMIIADEGLCILADFMAMKAKNKVLGV